MKDPDHPLWGILRDLLSYVPMVVVMLFLTNKWDGEFAVLAALLATTGGKRFLEGLNRAKSLSGAGSTGPEEG